MFKPVPLQVFLWTNLVEIFYRLDCPSRHPTYSVKAHKAQYKKTLFRRHQYQVYWIFSISNTDKHQSVVGSMMLRMATAGIWRNGILSTATLLLMSLSLPLLQHTDSATKWCPDIDIGHQAVNLLTPCPSLAATTVNILQLATCVIQYDIIILQRSSAAGTVYWLTRLVF